MSSVVFFQVSRVAFPFSRSCCCRGRHVVGTCLYVTVFWCVRFVLGRAVAAGIGEGGVAEESALGRDCGPLGSAGRHACSARCIEGYESLLAQ